LTTIRSSPSGLELNELTQGLLSPERRRSGRKPLRLFTPKSLVSGYSESPECRIGKQVIRIGSTECDCGTASYEEIALHRRTGLSGYRRCTLLHYALRHVIYG
jgi:hypothetical protein